MPDGFRNDVTNETVQGKGKAIPIHGMGALGGRGGIAPHSRPRH
jgi:hypothetical protein